MYPRAKRTESKAVASFRAHEELIDEDYED